MDVKDFYYDLPQEHIAQDPLEDRSSSRLMVLDKITGEVEHRHFKDITEYLRPVQNLKQKNTNDVSIWDFDSKNPIDTFYTYFHLFWLDGVSGRHFNVCGRNFTTA